MSLIRNSPSSLQDQFDKLSLDSLPDELLLPIFRNLSSFERALLLQTCKKWNQVILSHTPFWQYLRLSANFSPSSIVKILSIFNERSGCRLKHVVLETSITNVKHLNRIFVQLKRSGGSLKVLTLFQDSKLNGRSRTFAMQHLPTLNSFITFPGLEVLTKAIPLCQSVKFDVQDQSNVEPGLRFYFTATLLQLTLEDLKWLSKLKYLWVNYTHDIKSMRRILETTEKLVELDLRGWTTLKRPSSSEIRDLYLKAKPVHLQALERLSCPGNLPLALALSQMLEIDGDQTLLSGTSDSLVLWKVTGLRAIFLHLVPQAHKEEVEMLVGKARKVFQLNPMIQSLTLKCYRGGYGGDQYQINRTLGLLNTSSHSQITGSIAGEEADPSSGAVNNLLLPDLVKLTIEDPIKLDGNLFQRIVRARTKRDNNFRLEFEDSETSEIVAIDDWEARGWMD